MLDSHGLERIIVVPRNGYANRLQAWASSAILAAELDVPVKVLWEPEPVAPATAEQLFSPTLLRTSFIESSEVTEVLGRPHTDWPRYLNVERDVVVLAGHDLGEQHFMPELLETLVREPLPRLLVIIAGGKFHLPDSTNFELQRRVFYSRIDWSEAIRDRVDLLRADHHEYLGLHIRQTDRSITAPTAKRIRAALAELHMRTGIASLLVAADTDEARQHWQNTAIKLGLEPWTSDAREYSRSQAAAGIDAIVDWHLLGGARALVYPAASSFGEEAAVVTGNKTACIALDASRRLQHFRASLGVGRSVLSYPLRRMGRQ